MPPSCSAPRRWLTSWASSLLDIVSCVTSPLGPASVSRSVTAVTGALWHIARVMQLTLQHSAALLTFCRPPPRRLGPWSSRSARQRNCICQWRGSWRRSSPAQRHKPHWPRWRILGRLTAGLIRKSRPRSAWSVRHCAPEHGMVTALVNLCHLVDLYSVDFYFESSFLPTERAVGEVCLDLDHQAVQHSDGDIKLALHSSSVCIW